MCRYSLVTIFIAYFSLGSLAQQAQQIRYRDIVFDYITVQRDVRYYISMDPGIKEKYYLADVYEPYQDTSLKRPLIIWMHGGGFKFGRKESGGIPAWCRQFAGRGYICAAINYRLNKEKPLSDYDALVNQCMLAIQDLQAAIKFFKRNAESYKIDTNRIILAGNSAGGMIALQAVYSSTYEMEQRILQPGADNRSEKHNPLHIKAIVSFWGALFDINWLENAKVPIVSVHGARDQVVSITTKDSLFFGSMSIHQRADELGIPNAIKIYEQYAHELQRFFLPIRFGRYVRKRWKQAGEFAAGFLYEQLFQK
jgi:acetyl esterase/lipase